MEVYETSASGNKLQRLTEFPAGDKTVAIKILPDQKFQTITGFGGSFTESSASLLNKLSKQNRDKILEAYFGETGARYSLTRTHIWFLTPRKMKNNSYSRPEKNPPI